MQGGGGRGLGHFCYNMKTKIHEKQNFKKISQKALNHDLTLPSDSTRRELPESSRILENGLICVELWQFYCRERILVPMSSIICWEPRKGRMELFQKMSQKALNRILTLPNYSTGPGLLISSGIIDL